jgi:hypothetical protein
MVLLIVARLLIALVPFRYWRSSLGRIVREPHAAGSEEASRPVGLAHRRGVARLPITVKCLPQAMALQWMLRRRGLPSVLTIATLPRAGRSTLDDLHAWVAAAGRVLVGASPLPYVPVLHLQSGD